MKLRDIAARLREAAATLEPRPIRAAYQNASMAAAAARVLAEPAPRVAFKFGTLVITCDAYRESVADVAAKYERGFRRHTAADKLSRPTLRRPPNADAMLAALAAECGETLEPATLAEAA
jgi:hypothetical protein